MSYENFFPNKDDEFAELGRSVRRGLLNRAGFLLDDALQKDRLSRDKALRQGFKLREIFITEAPTETPLNNPPALALLLTPDGKPVSFNNKTDQFYIFLPDNTLFRSQPEDAPATIWLRHIGADGVSTKYQIDEDRVVVNEVQSKTSNALPAKEYLDTLGYAATRTLLEEIKSCRITPLAYAAFQ